MPEDEAMDHSRIDDERIVDRYLAGRLPPEEEALFEEHLFECADCLEQVEWGEELRRGLGAVAAEEAARAAAAGGLASLGLVAWLRSRRPAKLAALAGLGLALALLPALVLWQRAELVRLREAGPRVAAGGSGLARPTGDLFVVPLGVVRDAGDVAVIRSHPEKDAVLLSLELPPGPAARYRVTLLDAAGEVLWSGDGLEPNLYDTLLVALPSSYLTPGSYRITLQALTTVGAEAAGEIELRVLPEETGGG